MIKARKIAYTGMIIAALSLSACSNMSNRDQRMLSGAGIGAGTGAAIGAITGRDAQGRLAGSLAAHLVAVQNGAKILRVHDVAETVDALKVLRAIAEAAKP